MNTKPILAYDCATLGASVALRTNGHSATQLIGQTQQAAALVPTIDQLLRAHGVSYADLAAIVTTVGPGSFTGVRIGLAALHGFLAVHPVPIALLSTLEASAWHYALTGGTAPRVTLTLRAGKGEVYAQDFEMQAAGPIVCSKVTLYPETKEDWALPRAEGVVDAAVMAHVAQGLPLARLADAVPLYIRPPDAVVPQAYRWLQP